MTNSIRPIAAASLLAKGEAQDAESRDEAMGAGQPAARGKFRWTNQTGPPGAAKGGWRRNGRKVLHVKQRDLSGTGRGKAGTKWRTGVATPQQAWPSVRVGAEGSKPTGANQRLPDPTGVRASIVAMKRGNARGAKGRRKVDE